LEAAPEPDKHLDSCDGGNYGAIEIKHLIYTNYSSSDVQLNNFIAGSRIIKTQLHAEKNERLMIYQ
jgi:hypothetical protein